MTHYGQLLDSGYDPIQEKVYESFAEYFNNPLMTKKKNVDGYSVYYAKTNSMLGDVYRYIVVLVRTDANPIEHRERLKNLYWVSLQTRTIKENYNLPVHDYIPRRLDSLNKRITLHEKNPKYYGYTVQDLPIAITLLPKGKDNGLQYNTNGTVVTALETYYTVVTLL